MDFVDIYSVERTLALTPAFRSEGIRDRLQIKSMLWHAWQSSTRHLENLSPDEPLSRTQKKRMKRKQSSTGKDAKSDHKREKKAAEGKYEGQEPFLIRCPHVDCWAHRRLFRWDGLLSHMYVDIIHI